jgi:hypothetical protein
MNSAASNLRLRLKYIHIFIVIHSVYCERWGSHNAVFIHCMDLCLEGLMMTQAESKHVAILT